MEIKSFDEAFAETGYQYGADALELARFGWELHEKMLSETAPTAFAIRNDQGYWPGIYNERAVAKAVLAKGTPSHHEKIIALYER